LQLSGNVHPNPSPVGVDFGIVHDTTLSIGFLNIFGLFGKDRFVPSLIDKFDIFGFAETSISRSGLEQAHDPRNRFAGYHTFYSYCVTHTKGVALTIKRNIQVVNHSEQWQLPDILQGRFIAVERILVSSNPIHKDGFKAWMLAVYAPTNCDAATVRCFYSSLRTTLASNCWILIWFIRPNCLTRVNQIVSYE
jgi:hypothetical protein